MPLITYGINHKSAPIALREQLAFDPAQTTLALQNLIQRPNVNEAVLLSTCNRTEIYTASNDAGTVKTWLQDQRRCDSNDIDHHAYSFQGIHAVKHIMRVTSGLDSMIVGEPQIVGQIKQAYQLACDVGCVGNTLKHLFRSVFETSKTIRSQTAISASPVSLAYSVVQLAKTIFNDLKKCRVLLIGAGETIELIATHLDGQGVQQLIVANRTIEKAEQISKQIHAHSIRIGDVPTYLRDIDIIITATASQLPILGKGTIETALKLKKHRPILMVDLAVPRDIEPEVDQLEDVYLYNIDDLHSITQQNLKHRADAAKQAEAMIDMQAEHYMRQLRILDASELISQYRDQLSQLSEQELQKARALLKGGKSPEDIMRQFARNLTNKILHKPTVKLREAAYNEQLDMLLLAKNLFDL